MLLTAKTTWLIVGMVAGYVLMMATNPVRESLRDGWRALRRYPTLWLLLGLFGFAHALWTLGTRVYLAAILPAEEKPVFQWVRDAWRDPQLWLAGSPQSLWWLPHGVFSSITRQSVLPAVESVAGLFNNLVTTFPIAVLVAPALLLPWRGKARVLRRALWRRFRHWSWLIYLMIAFGALAAIGKAAVYATPQIVPPLYWVHWGQVVVSIAFVFEYLLGTAVQVFLLLLAFAWVRGFSFERSSLTEVAVRRFVVVLPWSALVLLLSMVVIDVPLMLKNFPATAGYFVEDDIFDRWLRLARAGISGLILVMAGVQIRLALHTTSWRQALREHFYMVGRAWWPFGWFLIVAGFHFFVWHALRENVAYGVGEGTALWVAWHLISPWLTGAIGGWLLASWVCVYKRYVRPHAPALEGATV